MENCCEKSGRDVKVPEIPNGNEFPMTSKDEDICEKPNEETAPMEIVTEFLLSVMSKNFEEALEKCEKILQHEPNNQMLEEFYCLLLEQAQGHDGSSEGSSDSWSSSSSDDQDKSNDQHDKSSSPASEMSSSESDSHE